MKKRIKLILMATLVAVGLLGQAQAEISPADFQKAMDQYLAGEQGQAKIGKSVETYFKNLQEKARKDREAQEQAALEEQFKNPVKIDIGNSPVAGPKNAAITIVEFSDFQCPYCSKAKATIDQIKKAYPNDVKVVFKHLPLAFHPNAEPAAKASMAAHKQGKFWEMHDLLFENQAKLGDELYIELAKQLKLDIDKFKKDMQDEDIANQIKADVKIAEKHEIRGTPGFFVGGVAVKGAYPFDHFKKIIDRLLKK